MSLALSTKLHAARTATLVTYDQAIASKAPSEVLDKLAAALSNLNAADNVLKGKKT